MERAQVHSSSAVQSNNTTTALSGNCISVEEELKANQALIKLRTGMAMQHKVC